MATQFSGGTYINYALFPGTYKCLIMQGILQNLCTNTVNAGWTNLSLGAGLGVGNVGTVSVTSGNPGIFTWTGHGFLGGEKICFQLAGGVYPVGITSNTVYYVKYIDADTFNIATSLGGTNMNLSTAGSGTLYCYTQTILLQAVAPPNISNGIVVRLQDNLSICVSISIQNASGSAIGGNSNGAGAALVPQSFADYQITATRYQFYCSITQAYFHHDFVLAGMLYIPPFLGTLTDEGFLLSNSNDASNTNVYNSFRNTVNIGVTTSNMQMIWNGGILDIQNWSGAYGSSYPGTPNVIIYQSGYYISGQTSFRWGNDDLLISDIFLAHGISSVSSPGSVRGQFYDMVFISDVYMLDATDSFGGHTWLNMTNNPPQSSIPRGGVWIATS